MKVMTYELSGAALDWAVGQADACDLAPVEYSSAWEFGGPIIEREKIGIVTSDGDANVWIGSIFGPDWKFNQTGPTPLIAAMRCYVASKIGYEVEVPDELLENEQ